jgi:hypothetical protein
MQSIVTYGNCQARGLAKLLRMCLPESEYSVEFISNNPRTGPMKSVGEIMSTIGRCNVLIYQPLRREHGKLSEDHIRQSVIGQGTTTVSLPYIFNSGMYSLTHAALASGCEYGRIYGEESVIPLVEKQTLGSVLRLYRDGQIDFGLPTRFSACIDELRRREQTTDIKLVDYIVGNYRQAKLFLTHNHPATSLFLWILLQIRDVTGLPLSLERIDAKDENLADLPLPYGSPISPYDKAVHGFEFDYRPDWLQRGRYLIALIARHHSGSQPQFNRLSALRWLLAHRLERRLRPVLH